LTTNKKQYTVVEILQFVYHRMQFSTPFIAEIGSHKAFSEHTLTSFPESYFSVKLQYKINIGS